MDVTGMCIAKVYGTDRIIFESDYIEVEYKLVPNRTNNEDPQIVGGVLVAIDAADGFIYIKDTAGKSHCIHSSNIITVISLIKHSEYHRFIK